MEASDRHPASMPDTMTESESILIRTYALKVDPAGETQLRASLEVMDPYAGEVIKGHRQLGLVVAQKLTLVHKLTEWREDRCPAVDWKVARNYYAYSDFI